MRYRKVLGLAIVLVALAVAMNALAFKTAQVTSDATFTISPSSTAAVSIAASSGSTGAGFTLTEASGTATLAIDDDMQPNSIYVFNNVFRIINNATTGTMSLDAPAVTVTGSTATITLYKGGTASISGGSPSGTAITGAQLAHNTGGATPSAGSYQDVDLVVQVPAGATTGAKSASIVINATQP